MSIKNLAGKRVQKEVSFMGTKLKISKLTVSELEAIQEAAKQIETDATKGYEVLKMVIKFSADGGSELTDDDFDGFAMDELSTLSGEIMKFSGVGASVGNAS